MAGAECAPICGLVRRRLGAQPIASLGFAASGAGRAKPPPRRAEGRRVLAARFCGGALRVSPSGKAGPTKSLRKFSADVMFSLAPLAARPYGPPRAAVAQLVEHVIRNDGVGGSSPFCGTSFSPHKINAMVEMGRFNPCAPHL